MGNCPLGILLHAQRPELQSPGDPCSPVRVGEFPWKALCELAPPPSSPWCSPHPHTPAVHLWVAAQAGRPLSQHPAPAPTPSHAPAQMTLGKCPSCARWPHRGLLSPEQMEDWLCCSPSRAAPKGAPRSRANPSRSAKHRHALAENKCPGLLGATEPNSSG